MKPVSIRKMSVSELGQSKPWSESLPISSSPTSALAGSESKEQNKKKKVRYRTNKPSNKMKSLTILVLVLCPGKVPALLGMKLDLLIHLSLQKGGTLPPQTGEYLQDSFRCESLIPAFSAVEQELKQLNTTDQWHMVGTLTMSGVGFIGNILLTWNIKELEKRLGGVSQLKEQA